jgi:nitroreductase
MTKISELLKQRQSTRDFSDQPLPPTVLDEILEDAMQSPSWANTQPYQLAIAQGETRDQLATELTRRFLAISDLQRAPKWRQLLAYLTNKDLPNSDYNAQSAYPPELQQRRFTTAKGLYQLLGIGRHDMAARDQQMARNFEFFGAPTVIFIFTHKGLGVYSVLDAGILLQSIMLAAQERGVASCAQGALALWRDPLEKHFDVPKDYKLLCGISLGYASEHRVNSYRPARLAVSELLLKKTKSEM